MVVCRCVWPKICGGDEVVPCVVKGVFVVDIVVIVVVSIVVSIVVAIVVLVVVLLDLFLDKGLPSSW